MAGCPATARIFERLGVDYCCGGKSSLRDACARVGRPEDEVVALLQQAQQAPALALAPENLPTAELIAHIEQTHHRFTRDELERAEHLMAKVLRAHGARHPELQAVAQALEALTQELLVHLHKEEAILFPYVRALAAQAPVARPPFGTVANPLRVMESEHEAAGELLRQLREATQQYTPPPDACPTFRALYDCLPALERDLHQHIHLENNVLFPKARAAEAQAFKRFP